MYTIEQTEVFERWFARLRDRVAKRRIVSRLEYIADEGHFGDFKPVSEKVFELRFHFGPGYRVYYMFRGDTVVFLLAGGDKASQERDIRRAIALAEEE